MDATTRCRSCFQYIITPVFIISIYLWSCILPGVYDGNDERPVLYFLIIIPLSIFLLITTALSGRKLWKRKLLFAFLCIFLWFGLIFVAQPLTQIALKLRVYLSTDMADCAKNAIQLEDHSVFAVCQFAETHDGMANTHYGAIIYETADWGSPAQRKFRDDVLNYPKKYDMLVDYFWDAYPNNPAVEKISGNYYHVSF